MGRVTDINKIEQIREATVELVSTYGLEKCSVSMIASKARVSTGYLYRHYPSKDALIADLVDQSLKSIVTRIEESIATTNDIQKIVCDVIDFVIEGSGANIYKYKFVIMLFGDFFVPLGDNIKEVIDNVGKRLIEMGRKNCSIGSAVTIEDLFIAMIGIPLEFLSIRYRFCFKDNQSNYLQWKNSIKRVSLELIKY